MANSADFILDQRCVEERKPDIGDTVVLVYAEWTKKPPDIGVLMPGGNDRYQVLTGSKIVYWPRDGNAPIYVINKQWI